MRCVTHVSGPDLEEVVGASGFEPPTLLVPKSNTKNPLLVDSVSLTGPHRFFSPANLAPNRAPIEAVLWATESLSAHGPSYTLSDLDVDDDRLFIGCIRNDNGAGVSPTRSLSVFDVN